MKDGDYQATIFPGTGAGLQAAIDYLGGTKGKVSIGPGTLTISTAISIHGGCHLEGSGPTQTVIFRQNGSVGGSDPLYSANSIISSAYGANGTLNTRTGAPQANITISDLCLDGNASAFSGVVFSDLAIGHYGIKLQACQDVSINNVFIKNFLQTGLDLVTCLNTRTTSIRVDDCGQYASAASRNSINISNSDSASSAAGWSQNHVIINFISNSPTDTNITVKNNTDIAVSNCQFTGGELGIEVESTTGYVTPQKNMTFSNVTMQDQLGNAIRLSPAVGIGYENIAFVNITADFHATLHGSTGHGQAVFLGRTNDAYLKGIRIDNCVFRNINSSSANTDNAFFVLGLPGTTQSSDIYVANCGFYGANGAEANAGNPGIDVYGNVKGVIFQNVRVFDVEDRGFYFHPPSGSTVEDVKLMGCTVDGGQFDGYALIVNSTAGTIQKVDIENCTSKNCAKGQSSRGFLIGVSIASGVCQDISVRGCRVYQTSGAINGFEIFQNGASTVDAILLQDNDTSDIGGGGTPVKLTGAPTGVHIKYPQLQTANITAASTITLLPGSFSVISGNTNIDNITNSVLHKGREIVLQCTGTPTFNHNSGGTGNLRCDGAANKVMTANDIIRFISDGTLWWQSSTVMAL